MTAMEYRGRDCPAFHHDENCRQQNPGNRKNRPVDLDCFRLDADEPYHVFREEISDERIDGHQIDASFALREAIEEEYHNHADRRKQVDRVCPAYASDKPRPDGATSGCAFPFCSVGQSCVRPKGGGFAKPPPDFPETEERKDDQQNPGDIPRYQGHEIVMPGIDT